MRSGLFDVCMNWIFVRGKDQSHCGASVDNSKATDLVLADDVIY